MSQKAEHLPQVDVLHAKAAVAALDLVAADEPGAVPSWQPAPLLVKLAADGKNFN